MVKERQIVECVPNFSEGRNMDVIKQIAAEVEQTQGVRLLNVDPGEATNRTVITFVGEPMPVLEAAFKAVRKAGQLIDMRQHHGAHPRIGATDVLPLIPVSGITLEECAQLARQLARRIAERLQPLVDVGLSYISLGQSSSSLSGSSISLWMARFSGRAPYWMSKPWSATSSLAASVISNFKPFSSTRL